MNVCLPPRLIAADLKATSITCILSARHQKVTVTFPETLSVSRNLPFSVAQCSPTLQPPPLPPSPREWHVFPLNSITTVYQLPPASLTRSTVHLEVPCSPQPFVSFRGHVQFSSSDIKNSSFLFTAFGGRQTNSLPQTPQARCRFRSHY